MIERPTTARGWFLGRYYDERRPAVVARLVAEGMDSQRAYSRADIEVKQLANANVPTLERFERGDPDLVEPIARDELRQVRKWLAGTHADRRAGLRRLREWSVLRTTIKEADARHRAREAKRAPLALREAQERIIREVVPQWQWPAKDAVAPGLRGLVETNRNGAIHIWTLYAEQPLSGAGGRFLDSLPRDVRVRVFGVTHGSLMETMLRRRGFEWSRYRWSGLRQGESVSARAWTWLYR